MCVYLYIIKNFICFYISICMCIIEFDYVELLIYIFITERTTIIQGAGPLVRLISKPKVGVIKGDKDTGSGHKFFFSAFFFFFFCQKKARSSSYFDDFDHPCCARGIFMQYKIKVHYGVRFPYVCVFVQSCEKILKTFLLFLLKYHFYPFYYTNA